MLGRRPDATPVRDAPAVRRFMPFLSPTRGESLVWFSHELRVDRALAFVEERNRRRPPDAPMTLFHVLLGAIARVLHERPRLNRFVAGGRLWQREGIWITLSAKKRFDDDSPVTTVKRRVDPRASLDELADHLLGGIRAGKSDRPSASDREVEWLLRLPPPLLRLALRAVHGVDALGLLPRGMIDADPMYTSVFVANLGSVGLDAGYHHLWEHGTCGLFCVVGRVREEAAGRVVTLKWTFDERMEDGLYCARGLERLRELVENPEKF